MTKKQKMQTQMIRGVLELCANNAEKINCVPKMTAKLDELKGISEALKAGSKTQLTAAKNKVDGNELIFNRLMKSTIALSSALYLYADEINDEKLKNIGDLQPSYIGYSSMESLYFRAEDIRKKAEPLLSRLAGFGLTSKKYNVFLGNLAEFHSLIGQNTGNISIQKKATGSIAQLIDKALGLLKTLDKYMNVMTEDEPEFAEAYFAARIVKNYKPDDDGKKV